MRKKYLPKLQALGTVEIFETLSKHDGVFLASRAADKGFDVILAAGGDGTLHQVINGVLRNREHDSKLPVVGLIPIGSGNDFARAASITINPDQLVQNIQRRSIQTIDVGKISFAEQGKQDVRYYINIADAGIGPDVVKRINTSDRVFGATFAYFSSIVLSFLRFKPVAIVVKTNVWTWSGKIRSFAVANGKYFGSGLCVAPNAKMNDGIFETFTCGDVSVLEFIRYSGALKREKMIQHPKVFYNKAQRVELSSPEDVMLEADGELVCTLPATIEIIPQRLNFLLG